LHLTLLVVVPEVAVVDLAEEVVQVVVEVDLLLRHDQAVAVQAVRGPEADLVAVVARGPVAELVLPEELALAGVDPVRELVESVVVPAELGLEEVVPVLVREGSVALVVLERGLVASAVLAELVVLVLAREELPRVELVSAAVLAFVLAPRSLVAQPWVLEELPSARTAATSGTRIPGWLVAGLVRPFAPSLGPHLRVGGRTERMPRSRCTTITARPWSMKEIRST